MYKRSYCKRVVKLGRKGFSQVEIAATLGVPRSTMRSWGRQHREFGEALEFARDHALAYWEGRARKAISRPIPKQGPQYNRRTQRKYRQRARVNERVWIKAVELRFPGEYSRFVAPDVAQQHIERMIVRSAH